MPDDTQPVQWIGTQAVVVLPEHVDVSNAGQIREQLLAVINRGASVLIADMTVTASCDHAGVDAVVRAYQRAVASGMQLRLVVTAPVVRRVLGIEGLDRLVSIFPTAEAAVAAGIPDPGVPALAHPEAQADGHQRSRRGTEPEAAGITPAVLWQVIDSLGDGLALTGDDGQIVLVNRQLAAMFGYEPTELTGRPVETLVPLDLRLAHRGYRAAYAQAPQPRPMGDRARLVGLRKDGGTFPIEVSLSPVPTATGRFILAVVRDVTEIQRREDLVGLARAAVAEQTRHGQELLDRVVHGLFNVGLSLQAATGLPSDVARERITVALGQLDDTIHEIRDYVFPIRRRRTEPPSPTPPGSAM